MDDVELLIWDSCRQPPTITGSLVLWQSYFEFQDDNIYSVPQLLEDDAEKFRTQYLALIYDLGEVTLYGKRIIDHLEIDSGFSYWWTTRIVEKCNFAKSPQIDNILRLMAFRDWFEKKQYKSIKLVTSNELLVNAIMLMSKELNVDFKYDIKKKKATKLDLIRRIYKVLPYSFQAVIWLVYNIIKNWSLKGVGVNEWQNTKAKITFISYLFNLDPNLAVKGQFGSGYWSSLPDMLTNEKAQTNWLHIYVKDAILPKAKAAKRMIKKFNSSHAHDQVHVTLYSFLSWSLIFDVLKKWWSLSNLKEFLTEPLQKKSGCYWGFLKYDYEVSIFGQVAISNVLFFQLFLKAMNSLPSQNKGVYLQENQGWEFGFIHAWRISNHSSCLIGVPHTPAKFWDLRSYFDPRSFNSLPMPDYIGINGDASKCLYRDADYPDDMLIALEALRYLYLDSEEKITNHKNITSEKNKTLLILGDYVLQSTIEQLNLLSEAIKLTKNNIRLLLKSHPACPINPEDYAGLNFIVVDKPISAIIDHCTLVYTSRTTSAAVDAYCADKLVITFLDFGGLNLSSLRGCEGVNFVSSAEELANILDNIEQIKVNDEQGKNFFYLNSKLPKWKNLLIGNDSKSREHF